MRYTFKVYERLKREQHINTLFRTGKAFSVFPVRFIYAVVPRAAEKEAAAQVGFSVPKKRFRSSVHRHRIRRLMVEAWRLNKHLLYESIQPNSQLHIFLIFTDSTMPDYQTVSKSVTQGISRLQSIVSSGELKNE